MTGVLAIQADVIPPGSGGGFSPVTHVYTTGSGTETIPSGASQLIIAAWGGGGGGGNGSGGGEPDYGGGGGGGAYVAQTYSLTSSDWGKTFTYVVGNGGAAMNNGTASTVANGTYGTTVAFSAGGGTPGGIYEVTGVGGTPVGGTTLVTGNNGTSIDIPPPGGAALIGQGGLSAGAGGYGSLIGGTHTGQAGSKGQVAFFYT